MAVVPNQARLLTLTARKCDVEYRITGLMNQTQRLAQESADLLQQRYGVITNFLSAQVVAGDQDQTAALNIQSSALIQDIDAQMAQISSAQSRLDIEQKKAETTHKAVCAEKESVEKVLDNSIKKEMGYFQ